MRETRSSRTLRERARELRRDVNPVEQTLWSALRDRRFRGLTFRRQHPLGPFVADFYYAEYHLVIEVDGAVHRTPAVKIHDTDRDDWLQQHDIRVLRLPAHRVMYNFDGILAQIVAVLEANRPRSK